MTADRPSSAQAAAQAWRDTIGALRALAAPTWIALAISIAIALVQRLVLPSEAAFHTGALLAGFVVAGVQAFLLTPYLIAVHRFIILGETATRYQLEPRAHRFQLFFLWSIALSLFYWVPAFAMGGSLKLPLLLSTVVLLVFTVAALTVSVRLIILFPALAVDAPGATWANAMADTRGNVWRILIISTLAALPALVGLIVVMLLARTEIWPFFSALLDGAMGLLTITLAIAVASRLYQRLGDRVNRAD